MKSTNTDSSSEDDLDRFRESVDHQFLHDDLYSSKSTKRTKDQTEKPVKLPSLRRNIDEEDETLNFCRVSPNFQKYVAKHLSAKLEEELREQEVDVSHETAKREKRKVKGCVKLLSTSLHPLKISKIVEEIRTQHSCKPDGRVDFDEALLEQECKQVAVDGADILSQKEVKCWSNRSKAAVFHYKAKKGVLEIQEKQFSSISYK